MLVDITLYVLQGIQSFLVFMIFLQYELFHTFAMKSIRYTMYNYELIFSMKS